MTNIGISSIHEYMYMYFGEVGKFKLPWSNVVDNLHQQIGYCLCIYICMCKQIFITRLRSSFHLYIPSQLWDKEQSIIK